MNFLTRMPRWQSIIIVCLAFAAQPAVLPGQPPDAATPAPFLSHLSPPAVSRGKKVIVTFAGSDLDFPNALVFSHPGITATPIQPPTPTAPPALKPEPGKPAPPAPPPPPKLPITQFEVLAAPTVPFGYHDVRLVGKFGVSNPRVFLVSGILEVAEIEPNNDLPEAKALPADSAAYGVIGSATDIDYYKLALKKDQKINLVVQATSIESPLLPILEVFSPAGGLLASSRGTPRQDAAILLQVRADGEYLVRLGSFSYQQGSANHTYRLVASLSHPAAAAWWPAAVAKDSDITQPIDLAANVGPRMAAAGSSPVGQIWPRPVVRGIHLLPAWWPGASLNSPAALQTPLLGRSSGGIPCQVETETHDTRDKAQILPFPVDLSGRMDKPNDEDWYKARLPAGKPLIIEAIAEQQGSLAELQLSVFSADGKQMLDLDDAPAQSPLGRFLWRVTDPGPTLFTPPAEAEYLFRVRSRTSAFKAGPDHFYRLVLRLPEPRFLATSITAAQYRPETILVNRGGSGALMVGIWRLEGFTGPVTITPRDLPPGVTCQAMIIPAGFDRGHLVFQATTDSPPPPKIIQLIATATLAGKSFEQTVVALGFSRPVAAGQVNLLPQVRVCREHWLTVSPATDSPPFRLTGMVDSPGVVAGGKANLKVQVERLVKEPKVPVALQTIEMPANFINNNQAIQVAPEAKEGVLPITVPAGTALGEYRVVVRGQVALPYNKDPMAKDKPATSRVEWSAPITLRVVPGAIATLRIDSDKLQVKKGGRVELTLKVERINGYTGPLQVVFTPIDAAKGLKVTTPVIPAGQAEIKVGVECASDAMVGQRGGLVLKVVGTWALGNLPISQEIKFNIEVKP